MAAQGRDIKLSTSRVEGYRNFATKLWNAARFAEINGCVPVEGFDPASAKQTINRWIAGEYERALASVTEALEAYRFNEAAGAIYSFIWHKFCDWYLELIKPRLAPESNGASTVCAKLVTLFEASLRLLHPVMPFITDEIWHAIYDGKPPQKSLALASYPQAEESQIDRTAETQMAILQDLIVSVRNVRAELKVETKSKVPIEVFVLEPEIRTLIEENRGAVERLANVDKVMFAEKSLSNLPGARHTARFDVHVIYEKKIDVAVECERLKKELEKIEKETANLQRQLANEQFLAKAPAAVIDKMRARVEELGILEGKARGQIGELGCG
jgi:valyl-tRNA synthetase